jgi:hypothetical protein
MLRIAFLTILILLGISSGIVYTQWNDYQHLDSAKTDQPLLHDITARYDGIRLEIKHHISGITAENYEVVIPSSVTDLSCKSEKNMKCVFYSKNGKHFIKTEGLKEIDIHYYVSLPRKKSVMWLDSWFVTFISEPRQQFHVEMIDITKNNGIWVAGAPLEGQVKRKGFTYYAWTQKDVSSFPLYFQSTKLNRTASRKIEIYSRKEVDTEEWEKTKAANLSAVPSLTVVVSPVYVKYIAPTLIVISEKYSFASIQADYMRSYYRSYYFPNSHVQEWVWDLLAAMALSDGAETSKAKQVLKELNSQLTNEEKETFLNGVLKQEGKELTLQLLDRALGSVRHGETTYFVDNGRQKEHFSPLLFKEKLELFVNGQRLEETYTITRNGERLLPFVEIMTTLGYHVNKSGEAVFIEKGYNSWRFFVNSNMYMKGSSQFGASSVIIHEINSKLYISEKMLQEWFYVETRERDNAIYINEQ